MRPCSSRADEVPVSSVPYQAAQLSRSGLPAAAACYCEDATFHDIAFDLTGKDDIAAMWRLVCSRLEKVEYRDIRTEGLEVKGHWICEYHFSKTHHFVHNEIDSTFTFRGGKIFSHRDVSSRWAWAKQALGELQALVVTALPFVLRIEAMKELNDFKEKEREGQGD